MGVNADTPTRRRASDRGQQERHLQENSEGPARASVADAEATEGTHANVNFNAILLLQVSAARSNSTPRPGSSGGRMPEVPDRPGLAQSEPVLDPVDQGPARTA